MYLPNLDDDKDLVHEPSAYLMYHQVSVYIILKCKHQLQCYMENKVQVGEVKNEVL